MQVLERRLAERVQRHNASFELARGRMQEIRGMKMLCELQERLQQQGKKTGENL